MGSWNDILKEVNETQSQYDYVRRKYLKELSDYTGRNTVAYYSSWLNKQGNNLDINDADMTGFMTCVHGLDCTKGLDLVCILLADHQQQQRQLLVILGQNLIMILE